MSSRASRLHRLPRLLTHSEPRAAAERACRPRAATGPRSRHSSPRARRWSPYCARSPPPFEPVATATSAELGEEVFTVSSADDYWGTVTSGIISYLDDREYQTDAATNGGSSGGALFNLRGKVIAVTSGNYTELNDAYYAVRLERLCDSILKSCPFEAGLG
ncbi:trypsin-like peptidase domain-containing protein [Luethyella okanaganae]|uniref:Trypsin-like peptidase domain-containing protein n=1 Tax=Luethyella okanaganae TaxID=69372 RepID=A0ABW1VGS6_9MICO